MDKTAILTRKNILILVVAVISFILAYSIDQYYIYKKQFFFMAKPINYINQLFNK